MLSVLVAHVLVRTLRRDIATYQELSEDLDTGWKQVARDVYRPPALPGLFCAVIGSGVQFAVIILLLITCAVIGFITPEHRGALLSTLILLFVFTTVCAGFTASRLYKFLRGPNWASVTL